MGNEWGTEHNCEEGVDDDGRLVCLHTWNVVRYCKDGSKEIYEEGSPDASFFSQAEAEAFANKLNKKGEC